MEEQTLTTLRSLARRLRVTQRWLRTELEAGRLPGLRAENRWLCDAQAVEAELLRRARGEGNGHG